MPGTRETDGPEADAIGGGSNPESLTPHQGSIEDYRALLEELRSLSEEELRSRADAKGIDAPHKLGRDELLAKLMDEPGANEH